MKKLTLAIALACMFAGSSAFAVDWNGVYIGTSVQTNSGDYHVYAPSIPFVGPTYGLSGTMGSADLGYNIDTGSFVYGAELSTSVWGVTSSTSNSDYVNAVVDAKLRAGFKTSNVLIYGIVGMSSAYYDSAPFDFANVSGMSFGAGIEYLSPSHYYVGIEYLSRTMTGVIAYPDYVEVNLDTIAVRAGILF